jgi:glycosyltransferase involved in cell wall biosynthesis
MRSVLFIPCYNVADSVIQVLREIPDETLEKFQSVLLVDNGSYDGTRDLLKDFVKGRKKFRLFFNETNYSLGGSSIIAIREAIAENADFLICMHSDGQADPADLKKFFPLSLEEDFVFGSRLLPESNTADYSRLRQWGNIFFSYLQKRLLGQNVQDIGAFVAVNLHLVAKYPYFRIESGMSYFPSLVLHLSRQKRLRCREFPVFWGPALRTNVNIWSYGIRHLLRLAGMCVGYYPLTKKSQDFFVSSETRCAERT